MINKSARKGAKPQRLRKEKINTFLFASLCANLCDFASLRALLLLIFLYSSVSSSIALATQASVITQVEVSPKTVIIGQPVDIKIGVFTSTYFTKAAEFEKVTIPAAFTIPASRPLSTNTQIDGKTFYGVEYSYKLFPAQDGVLLFPSLDVIVNTPDESDYKAEPRTVKTAERRITINPVPIEYQRSTWLVADNVSVSESWNRDLTQLQVGDAIERTIIIQATGTVAALIPPIQHDSLAWGRLYPKSPLLSDDQSEGLKAKRIERLTYLAAQAGSFMLPEIELGWWTVSTQQYNKKSLPARDIVIAENPDLAMLRSMQDSLDALKSAGIGVGENKAISLFGFKAWQLFIIFLLAIAAFLIVRYLVAVWRQKAATLKALYRQSEAFYFHQLEKSLTHAESLVIYQNFIMWIDRLSAGRSMPVRDFINAYGDEVLATIYKNLEQQIFNKGRNSNGFQSATFFQACRKARTAYLKRKRFIRETSDLPALNPDSYDFNH